MVVHSPASTRIDRVGSRGWASVVWDMGRLDPLPVLKVWSGGANRGDDNATKALSPLVAMATAANNTTKASARSGRAPRLRSSFPPVTPVLDGSCFPDRASPFQSAEDSIARVAQGRPRAARPFPIGAS